MIIRLCLVLEKSGICSAAWLLAIVQKKIFGYQTDEVHLANKDNSIASYKSEEVRKVDAILDETERGSCGHEPS